MAQESEYQIRNNDTQSLELTHASSVVVRSGEERDITTREDVEVALTASSFGSTSSSEALSSRSFTFDASSSMPQSSDNRTVYYVIGGALVVGGAIAGILALGDDGGGTAGIPAPPARP